MLGSAVTLQTPVSEFFATAGVLARTLSGFAPRESQRLMVEAVAETIANAGQLLVEAGTGTGNCCSWKSANCGIPCGIPCGSPCGIP